MDTPHPDNPDRLLKAVLQRAAPSAPEPAASPHPDDEILALFAAGELPAAERPGLVDHLAECDACRKVVSLSLRASAGATVEQSVVERQAEPRAGALKFPAWARLALAATLLIAVGFLLFRSDRHSEGQIYHRAAQLLDRQAYDEARQELATAAKKGVDSDRLHSLDAQAVREIPSSIALVAAGRLTDFGYEPGGVVARDPAQQRFGKGLNEAQEILDRAGAQELEVLLNRGHLALTRNDSQRARQEFEAARRLNANHPLASLGLGLAAYMQDDFPAAANAFLEALRLEPQNRAGKLNLAMTLEELNQVPAAIDLWRELLREPLPAAERRTLERHLRQLTEAAQP